MNYLLYIRMALGLPVGDYTLEMSEQEQLTIFAGGEPQYTGYVWTDTELANEICKVWNITRERFIRAMAAPKPTHIQHLVYNAELKARNLSPLPKWPSGRGLIVPKWEAGKITTIRFFSMREILRPKVTNEKATRTKGAA